MDFKKNKLAKFSLALLCILLISVSVSAAATPFTVDEPDGTGDSTSAYYTIEWTPKFDYVGIDANMIQGINTITCYLDGASSGYDTTTKLVNAIPCCDTNNYQINVGAVGGRGANAEYYIWCINDQNTDINAYSGGTFTLSRFGTTDMGTMSIDIVSGIVGGIADNATALGVIVAVIIIITLLLDVFTDVFGIFKKLKELSGRGG